MTFFTGHYGLDWAAGVFMLLSLWRFERHKRDGFLFAGAAAVFWTLFNVHVESAPGIAINVLVLGLSIRSWRRWTPADAGGRDGAG